MWLTILPALLAMVGIIVGDGNAHQVWADDQPTVANEHSAEKGKTLDAITNVIGMKLVRVPAGEFLMGSLNKGGNEHQHPVRITKAFYLGVYAVTQEEYEKVVGKNPSLYSSRGLFKDKVAGTETKRYPVENISWNDAMAFCKALSEKDRRSYRLPTEAEWEYACRAGTTTEFSCGDEFSCDDANCREWPWPYKLPQILGLYRPITVGSYAPNPFGLYDMHGNVWQWCADWYDSDYYLLERSLDPTGPRVGKERVVRGGSFDSPPVDCRSAARWHMDPKGCGATIGLRVASE